MAKILINDGIHPSGLALLRERGFEVSTDHIPQDKLQELLPLYDAICVRSATKVRKGLIDQCPNLKLIGRGGVGMDNIDVDYARSKGIHVVNTPAASSRSVAELAIGHLLGLSRFIYQSNREMPERGQEEFKKLKKSYSKGGELSGKTLGIIGLGKIGEECAKIALGLEMNVIGVDPFLDNKSVDLKIGSNIITVKVPVQEMNDMLSQADFISLHVPFTGEPVLGKSEFDKMKEGAIVVNAARGGVIDEGALLEALDSGKLACAGLDVFENEPAPDHRLLQHPRISLTPHIGASTVEAQEKIGIELANTIIELLS